MDTMISQQSFSTQDKIYALIGQHRLNDAFAMLNRVITDNDAFSLADELSAAETSYKYLIQYFIAGSEDPRRELIRAEIIESLYSITDRLVMHIEGKSSGEQYFLTRRFSPTSFDSIIATYRKRKSDRDLFTESGNPDVDSLRSLSVALESAEATIFDYVWTRFPISSSDLAQIESLLADASLPTHIKVLIVAALYQSAMKFYQEPIVALLLSLYTSAVDEVAVAALCCALIAMHRHSGRIAASERIASIIATLSDVENFRRDVASIFFLLTRSRDTERLSKRVHDEIIPEIKKISPIIINKFKDAQSVNDITDLEANPEWHNILESSGLQKKIEEFNDIQLSGADVFMSTFAKLKSFPFFSRISNWFLPFHTDNSAVLSSLEPSDKLLLDMVNALPILCDSDKYSFFLSLAGVPTSHKQMMASQFSQQNDMLKEMGKNLPKSKGKTHDEIANRFIQDLFRFAKLNKYHGEFYDPFSTSLNLRAVPVIAPILDNTDTLSVIGEYCMKNEHYHEAIDCFSRIMELDADVDASFIQKRGFCNQCLKNYQAAINDYLKFDLFTPDNLWNITHTAACYRALRQNQLALECYRRAEALAPENVSVCLNIGHCLLDLGNTAEALKAYYKVDYIDTSKHRAWRPIAWCAFLLGNFDQSLKYYEKVLADTPSAHDFLNIGHLHLCRRDFASAARYYRHSVKEFGSFKDFLSSFRSDVSYLTDKGITTMERDLILDYLQMPTQD